MNINAYNYLLPIYTAMRNENDVDDLSKYIHRNIEYLALDLSKDESHQKIYQDMTRDLEQIDTPLSVKTIQKIKEIQYAASLLKIAGQPQLILKWLNENQTAVQVKKADLINNPGRFFEAIDALTPSEQYRYIFDGALSEMVMRSFGLSNLSLNQLVALFPDRNLQVKMLPHFINMKHCKLKDLQWSLDKIKALAPYLRHVDCRDLEFKDEAEVQEFIKAFPVVYSLFVNSGKITELKSLPGMLRNFDCSDSPSLKGISLSNLLKLKCLTFYSCFSLKELSLSNLPELEVAAGIGSLALTEVAFSHLDALKSCWLENSRSLKELTLSNLPSIEEVSVSGCYSLKDISLSNLEALKSVDFGMLPSLTELSLSHLPSFSRLDCMGSTALRQVTLSHLEQLTTVDFSSCSSLQSIVCTGLPQCLWFDCSGCPGLRQLPQLPPMAQVFSDGSFNYGSFEVELDELNTRPLDILCNLGDMLLRDQRIPNIVYLHSEGIDYGGLRRQLVTTLLKNLFQEEDSPILRLKTLEGIFPLLSGFNERQAGAFITLGALIGFAAMGSLPLGRFLHPGFYSVLRTVAYNAAHSDEEIYKLALYGDPDWDLEEQVEPVALPIRLAAQGFKKIVGEALTKLCEIPLKDFVDQVAGEEISWERFDTLATYRNDDSGKTREYFKTFFEKNPERLADVIELFTSSRSFGKEGIKIFVDDKLNKENLFTMTTCFQQVTIPSYDTYDAFERKLLATIKHTLGRFGKG